ncbi:oligopeptide transport system permease protein [Arthrobacter silviterrae]|uniref:ABC transporter permease n=1 Tax=Arthrobacter silviterrae TaxID=2026658 RepID=A0ABX0DES9_9MICC|nr:ABC transporter permease [Arthrobacter silviterrae]MDQ0277267.1 oligopeptide transport system permease protein [Arthrobacter silviterrae]NGN82878.1 ABC transporter permease [Arthrobacter silviterrae]
MSENLTPETDLTKPVIPAAARQGKTSSRAIVHFVAPLEETPLAAIDNVDESEAPLSLWADAWRNLRRQPLFIISAILIVLVLVVAFLPQLFANVDPTSCTLNDSSAGPRGGHPMGFTLQGCDVYSRMIYGTRASLMVGVFTTLGVLVFGGIMGALAGYYGGWVDAILARLGDVFFALPLILGAIVMMQLPAFRDNRSVWTVVLTLVIFGWPQIARITRGAVIENRNADFVTAAKALGLSRFNALVRHVLPNSLAPIIVVASISLGTFIVAEATLSFLGIGLPDTVMSWGNDIAAAQPQVRNNPGVLLWPAAALSVTVLSFIMLGDALRDALDPKARKR